MLRRPPDPRVLYGRVTFTTEEYENMVRLTVTHDEPGSRQRDGERHQTRLAVAVLSSSEILTFRQAKIGLIPCGANQQVCQRGENGQ